MFTFLQLRAAACGTNGQTDGWTDDEMQSLARLDRSQGENTGERSTGQNDIMNVYIDLRMARISWSRSCIMDVDVRPVCV